MTQQPEDGGRPPATPPPSGAQPQVHPASGPQDQQDRSADQHGWSPPGYGPVPTGWAKPAPGEQGNGQPYPAYGQPGYGQPGQQYPASGRQPWPDQSYGRQGYGPPDYGQSPPDYGQGPPDYGQPAPGQQTPPPGYGQHSQYGAPVSNPYGQPAQGQDYGRAYGYPPQPVPSDYHPGYPYPSQAPQPYGQPGYGQPEYAQPDYARPEYGQGYPSAGGYSPPPPDLQAMLSVDDGSHRTYQLQRGSNVVGRGQDASFRLPDTSVSRRHVDIYFDGQVAVMHDLGSTNGTSVNGSTVQTWQLADGDVIRVGHSTVVFTTPR